VAIANNFKKSNTPPNKVKNQQIEKLKNKVLNEHQEKHQITDNKK
jgi:hypothetical protein